MASRPRRGPLHIERPGLIVPVRRDPAGVAGPTPGQARGSGWRRTSRGYYVPASIDSGVPEQRVVEAAVVLPAYGGVTGWAALRWLGGVWFDGVGPGGQGELPVSLAVSECDIRPQRGIRVAADALPPHEIVAVDGLPVTVAARSLLFEMRHARHVRAATVLLDMACYSDLVTLAEMAAYAAAFTAVTGIGQVRDAVALGEENSWSPRETLTRLVWTLDAGLPRPLCNVPVFDRYGRHVGTPDLLDPEAGVVGEYEGALHLVGAQRRRDRDREEGFRAVGLEYLTILAGDHEDSEDLVRRIHAVRARAAVLSGRPRAWTLQPPTWWVPTTTVRQRRALEGRQRDRLLRLRLRVG